MIYAPQTSTYKNVKLNLTHTHTEQQQFYKGVLKNKLFKKIILSLFLVLLQLCVAIIKSLKPYYVKQNLNS